MDTSEPSRTDPAISPADLATLWQDLWRWLRIAEADQDEASDSTERYYGKVGIDAAHWNLAYLHGALVDQGRGGYCQEKACTHLSGGLSDARLAALLGELEAGLRNNAGKLEDPRLKRDGQIHQRRMEQLRDALLKRRRT